MDAFYKSSLMKNHFSSYIEKEILAGIVFIFFCIFGGQSFVSNYILLMFCLFYVVGATLLLDKYLSYPVGNNLKGFLAGVVKYHAFDSDLLFKQIGKKLAITEGIMAVCFSVSMVADGRITLVPMIFLLLIVPAVMFLAMKAFFTYRTTRDIPTAMTTWLILCYSVLLFVEIIVLAVVGIVALMVGYAIVSDRLSGAKIAENVVAYRVYHNVLIQVLIVLLGVSIGALFYFKNPKIKKWVRIGALTSIVFCLIGSLVSERANNTLIMENHIVCTSNFQVTEYDFSEVSQVNVSMGNSEVRMELLMEDGNTIQVVDGSFTNTQAWGEKYYSLYNFMSDLTDRMLSQGATGSVRDVEDIREYVKNFDPECIRGMEEVITMLQ